VSFVSYLVLQEEQKEVFGAVGKGDISTIDKFIKKYGINNIRDSRYLGVSDGNNVFTIPVYK